MVDVTTGQLFSFSLGGKRGEEHRHKPGTRHGEARFGPEDNKVKFACGEVEHERQC